MDRSSVAAAEGRILQCRIWWPQHLCCHKFGRIALFGWENRHGSCIDFVVASALPMAGSMPSTCRFNPLKGLLQLAMEVLPGNLGRFRILGECSSLESTSTKNVIDKLLVTHSMNTCLSEKQNADPRGARKSLLGLHDKSGSRSSLCTKTCKDNSGRKLAMEMDPAFGMHFKNDGGNDCPCSDMVADIQSYASAASTWLQLSASSTDCKIRHGRCVPKLHRLQMRHTYDLAKSHVVVYEQPCFGSHDFCLENQRFSCSWHGQSFICKKPQWMIDLDQHQYCSDMEKVILQLNCAATAQNRMNGFVLPNSASCKHHLFSSILSKHLLCLVAVAVALGATVLSVFAELVLYMLEKSIVSLPGAHTVVNASQVCRTLHYRCKELLAWPLVLSWGGKGPPHPNVSLAHRMSLRKHLIWSAIVFDMIFGIISGGLLLVYRGWIMQLLYFVSQFVTNDILRTGCIWLMGVPAGFKLNNELAGMFGTAALNVIQMWSTLWCFCKPVLGQCIEVLAVTAMVLGVTVSAAIVVDILSLATIHISVLYQATAFIYSIQLRTLAALWRLFRGRKYNPLRTRIDSYDYTVEQLVVASLMFTPLLLLLPTTSVFYTFFTIIFASLSLFRYFLQMLMVVVGSFPYIEVGMWFFKPQRFSCGIWFQTPLWRDVKPCNSPGSYFGNHDEIETSAFKNSQASFSSSSGVNANRNSNESTAAKDLSMHSWLQSQQSHLVSLLGSNTASLGIILHPVADQLWNEISQLSAIDLLYKMVSGGRLPHNFSQQTRGQLPQSALELKTFFRLCYDSMVPPT
ncbi:hypothetical protein O6H91_14G007200 [Diphasiastrum complanatum]|nr:hypothetical protein O6H91_14G007200 [Diphasiastrum complanatum]